MVCSRLPECIVALHSLVSDKDILHGVVKGMSHVQLSCDVWWWHHDCEWFFAAVYLSMEVAIVFPLFVKTVLDVLWIVGFV